MHIGVVYSEPLKQIWLKLDLEEGSTVEEAIKRSGILSRFTHIDLSNQKVGIYGKIVKLDTVLKEGDRVEIYRPIIADPKTVKRRKTEEDDD